MAKKITLEEYEKQKRQLIKPNNSNFLMILSIVLFIGILTITGLHFYSIKHLYSVKATGKIQGKGKLLVSCNNDSYIDLNKLDFFDENIVFIVEELGNKYYSYDCLMEKLNNEEYEYTVFTKNAAIKLGYKEGNCS